MYLLGRYSNDEYGLIYNDQFINFTNAAYLKLNPLEDEIYISGQANDKNGFYTSISDLENTNLLGSRVIKVVNDSGSLYKLVRFYNDPNYYKVFKNDEIVYQINSNFEQNETYEFYNMEVQDNDIYSLNTYFPIGPYGNQFIQLRKNGTLIYEYNYYATPIFQIRDMLVEP